MRGVLLTSLYSTLVVILSLVFQVVKANYLSGSDFALIASMWMLIAFGDSFVQAGLPQLIIKKDTITTSILTHYLVVNYAYSIAYFLFVGLALPFIQMVYHFERLDVIGVAFMSIFIGIPTFLLKPILEKELRYGKFTLINSSVLFVNITVGSILLFLGFKIYSIFIARICSSLVDFLMTYIVVKKTNPDLFILPKDFRISGLLTQNRSDIIYGVQISGRRLVNILSNKLDEFLVGFMFSGEELGIYYFAKDIYFKIINLLNSSVSKILLPVFSITKARLDKSTLVYSQFIKLITYLGVPIIVIMLIAPSHIIRILFSDKWIDSSQIFQYLSIGMLFALITSNITTSLLTIHGRAKDILVIEARTVLLYIFSLGSIVIFKLNISIIIIVLLLDAKMILISLQNHNKCLNVLHIKKMQFILNNFNLVTFTFIIFLAVSLILTRVQLNTPYDLIKIIVGTYIVGAITVYISDKKSVYLIFKRR